MKYYCDNQRHLVCIPYSIENLHKMAKELNINQCWFHKSKYPHYDIPKRRIKEIQEKCKIISSKDILKICKGQLFFEIIPYNKELTFINLED